MSSLVIKISSLVIKSLSKPIANRIKAQAREHERFRKICINLAQGIHRYDMRFRLGLLQDSAAIDKQIAKEAAEAQAKKHKHEAPTVKTEAQTKADEITIANAKEKGTEQIKEDQKKKLKPKIRPLSEGKAIDSGANFVSETFLLVVAIGCIAGERWYNSKKETSRREDVAGRIGELEEYEKSARKGLVELEKEILRLKAKEGIPQTKRARILPREVYELEEQEEEQAQERQGWFSWINSVVRGSGKKSEEELKPEFPIRAPQTKPTVVPQNSPNLYERIVHPISGNNSDSGKSRPGKSEPSTRSRVAEDREDS